MSETDERIGQAPDTVVGDSEVAATLDAIRAKTGAFRQPDPEPYYNHPDRWFMRQDGHIVKLPGNPQARSYYEAKGFYALSPAEVREWETKARPVIVAEQRKRAQLISTIRRIVREHPKEVALNEGEYPLDDYDTDELEEKLSQMRTALPAVVVFTAPAKHAAKQARADAERDRADGVETGSGPQIEAMVARSKQAGRGAVSGG